MLKLRKKSRCKFIIGGVIITAVLLWLNFFTTFLVSSTSETVKELQAQNSESVVSDVGMDNSVLGSMFQISPTMNTVIEITTTLDLVPWEWPTNGWNPLIAHGFGEWDGVLSPNNYEAFIDSYSEGFRTFETDIMVASDGIPILAHDRQELNYYGMSGVFSDYSSSEFLTKKINGKGTTLAGPQLLDLLMKYPDIRIVLDLKIENQTETLGWFLDRLPKSQWPRLLSNIRSEKQMQELVKLYPDYRGSFFQLGPWREDLVYTDKEVKELVKKYNLAGVFTWVDELDPNLDFIQNNKSHRRWTRELELSMIDNGKAMIWHTTDDPVLIKTRREAGGAIITNNAKPKKKVKVVIISIDGLSPKEISLETTPNLLKSINTGAYTLQAQSVEPSATLPSHASMLSGSCPETHGVTWNDYQPDRGYANSLDLFELADNAGLRTAMVTGKVKLSQISEPENIDYYFNSSKGDLEISTEAMKVIENGFDLLFIHLPDNDLFGHQFGWLSDEQLSHLYETDKYIGTILSKLDEVSDPSDSLVIITADHGGHEKSHGSTHPDDMTIPWIISGERINYQLLTIPVSVVDTSPTIAWVMDLPLPTDWDGQIIYEVFGETSNNRTATICQ